MTPHRSLPNQETLTIHLMPTCLGPNERARRAYEFRSTETIIASEQSSLMYDIEPRPSVMLLLVMAEMKWIGSLGVESGAWLLNYRQISTLFSYIDVRKSVFFRLLYAYTRILLGVHPHVDLAYIPPQSG